MCLLIVNGDNKLSMLKKERKIFRSFIVSYETAKVVETQNKYNQTFVQFLSLSSYATFISTCVNNTVLQGQNEIILLCRSRCSFVNVDDVAQRIIFTLVLRRVLIDRKKKT